MFSFFPCLPYNNENSIFSRPIILIKDFITDTLSQNFKYKHKEIVDLNKNQQLWKEIKKQVEEQHLKIGIYSNLPLKRRK